MAHGRHQVHTLLAAARSRYTRPQKHAVVWGPEYSVQNKLHPKQGLQRVLEVLLLPEWLEWLHIKWCLGKVVVYAATGHTSFCKQVGSELGCNGLPPLSLTVSPGIAKVRHDCSDGTRRGSLASIDHDEQLHQGVIDWRARRLNQEDIATTY